VADHLHTQIAQAAAARLNSSDVPSANGAVKPYRVHPINPGDLPYGSAWVPAEEPLDEAGDGDDEDLIVAVATLMVAWFVKSESPEPLLNQFLLETQQALAGGLALGGQQLQLVWRGCEKTYEGADQDYSEIAIQYDVEIAYNKGTPDVLAWQ